MKHLLLMSFFLLLTSCAIEEIEGIPSLNPPLGLVAVKADDGGIGIYFSGYNKETYFYGYSIFVSPRKADFEEINNYVFGVDPRTVVGSQAEMFTNTSASAGTITSVTMPEFIMSTVPEAPFVYPVGAQMGTTANPANIRETNFISSPLKTLPGGLSGVLFVAVYAYSEVNDDGQQFSLPSNIYEVTF
ncbi:MAG: hypothetical protein ACRCS8_03480 [Brevinema sp.]